VPSTTEKRVLSLPLVLLTVPPPADGPSNGIRARPKSAGPTKPSGGAGKKGARTYFMDQEQMYFEIQNLKKQVTELTEEKTMLRSKNQRFETEVGRKEKQIETLLSAKGSMDRGENKSVYFDKLRSEAKLIANLKAKNKILQKKLRETESKVEDFKSDSKYTKLAEKELEVQTYYKESMRLRELLEERARVQDGEDAAQEREHDLLEEMHRKLKSLKAENKELKRDARALVEKTAEWEEENRYLQQELKQTHRKLTAIPKKSREALVEASKLNDTKEISLAYEKAQVDLEMQEIQHTEEIKDLLAAKRGAEQKLQHQLSVAESVGLGGSALPESYWEDRLEHVTAEYEARLGEETSKMKAKFKQIAAQLVEKDDLIDRYKSQLIDATPPMHGERGGAPPVSGRQEGRGGGKSTLGQSGMGGPSFGKSPPSPGGYVSSPELGEASLRYSDDGGEENGPVPGGGAMGRGGSRHGYSFGEDDSDYPEANLEQETLSLYVHIW